MERLTTEREVAGSISRTGPTLRRAYLLYGNLGDNFPSNVTRIFLAPKAGTGLSCSFYKIPLNFSLSLDIKPGTSNSDKWYRKFWSFR